VAERIPDWFFNAVLDGIQRLYVLSLPRTPSADTIELTQEVWVEALWSAARWDEDADRPRLASAFRALERTATEWPSPRLLLQHLPRRSRQAALPAPGLTEEQRRRNQARIRELVRTLKGGERRGD